MATDKFITKNYKWNWVGKKLCSFELGRGRLMVRNNAGWRPYWKSFHQNTLKVQYTTSGQMWQFNFLLNNLHEKFDETFLNCAHAQHRMDFLRNLTLLYHLNHGVLAFCCILPNTNSLKGVPSLVAFYVLLCWPLKTLILRTIWILRSPGF